jgi:hypothetical protein
MIRELWRQFPLDRLQFASRFGPGQVPEHAAHAVHGRARPLQRGDRIVEGRRVRVADYGRDFRLVVGHGALVGRLDVRRFDALERRQFERPGPGLEKRVLACGSGHG